MADEDVVLGHQRDEVEVELPCGCLDAKARIRHAAGHIGRDSRVREFDLLVALDARTLEPLLRQQLVKQHARARFRVAVDQADTRLEQLAQRGDAPWIALADD